MSQQDRAASLQNTLDSIQQRWGPEALRRLAALAAPACLPGGIPALDELLGGGLPPGRIVELSGEPGSGVPGLALAWMAGMPQDYSAVVIDTPGSFDPEAAAAYGLRIEELVVARPASPPEALAMAEDFAAAALPLFITLDLSADPAPLSLHKLARLLAPSPAIVLALREAAAPPLPGAAIRLRAQRLGWLHLDGILRGIELEVSLLRQAGGGAQRRVVLPLVFGRAG